MLLSGHRIFVVISSVLHVGTDDALYSVYYVWRSMECDMKENMIEAEKQSNENLLKTMRITNEMLALADEGDLDRLDDSCAILYGLLRDMAYQLRKHAEQECERHKDQGRWN